MIWNSPAPAASTLAIAAVGWTPAGREPAKEAHDWETHMRAAVEAIEDHGACVTALGDACVVYCLVVNGMPVERGDSPGDLVLDLEALARCEARTT